MRALTISTAVLAIGAAGCISSLPDDPVELPDGPVNGLAPVYLTDAEARAVAFLDSVPDFTQFFFDEDPLAVDTLLVVLDTGRGLFVGGLDTFGRFEARSYLSVPGVSRLDVNAIGELVFDNYGDRVTGRLSGSREFVVSFRTPDAFPPARTSPRLIDLERARDDLDRPSNLVRETYFACYDPTRGLIGGWEVAVLTEAPCLTNLRRF